MYLSGGIQGLLEVRTGIWFRVPTWEEDRLESLVREVVQKGRKILQREPEEGIRVRGPERGSTGR